MESAIIFAIPLMLMGAGTSGSNELADFLETKAYWESRAIEVTADNMLGQVITVDKPKDISALIKQLGADEFDVRESAYEKIAGMGPSVVDQLKAATKSSDPEVADRAGRLVKALSGGGNEPTINKIMAIRALGELKDKKGLPVLTTLLKSKEPFVADYAARAIAMIKGEMFKPPAPTAAELDKEVWKLPKGCKTVAQMTLDGGKAFSFEQAFGQAGFLALHGQKKDQMRAQMNQSVLMALNMVGNVRIESATIGLSGDPGNNTGFVCAIIRGKYDRKKVEKALVQFGNAKTRVEQGITIASPEDQFAILLVSDTEIMLVGGANQNVLPIKAMIAAAKTGKGTFHEDAKMVELVASVKDRTGGWGILEMTETYRQLDWLKPYDTVKLERVVKNNKMHFTITCTGSDEKKVKKVIKKFQADMAELKKQFAGGGFGQMMPKQLKDMIDSVKVQQQGSTAIVTGVMPAGIDGLMGGAMLPWLFLMGAL